MAANGLVGRIAGLSTLGHSARLEADGNASHPHVARLRDGSGADHAQALGDLVHLLSQLYGRHPGLIDLALGADAKGPSHDWLGGAATAFERERLYVVRLTSAVGPVPSTPGAAHTEAALSGQRHALETLARSERRGCALGASTALVADWRQFRSLLDRAATRMGVAPPPLALPDDDSVDQVIANASDSPAVERAIRFGADQLLLQHRALLDLLEARAEARSSL